MCSSMKQPKPERLVEILGMPITVHSAAGRRDKDLLSFSPLLKSQQKPQRRPLLAPLTNSWALCSAQELENPGCPGCALDYYSSYFFL